MMVKVKICGITNVRDANWAARCGADALGFNFVPHSPRYIGRERVRAIVMELPPFLSTVGVFVDTPPEEVREIVEFCGLNYAQLHGHETPRKCQKLKGIPLIKAFRVRGEDDLRELQHYDVRAYLLDTYVKGKEGGTGESFDWEIAAAAAPLGHIILAGGLDPDNVKEGVRAARPFAVDVASGVEEVPGIKSRLLVERFIRRAKSVDV